MRRAFQQQGVQEPLYWLATLDGSQPWAPGIVAIQTTNAAHSGGAYDLSVVLDVWPGVDSPEMADLNDIAVKLDQLIGMVGGSPGAGHSSLLWDGINKPRLDQLHDQLAAIKAQLDGLSAGRPTAPFTAEITPK